MDPNAIDGQRILHVLGVVGEAEDKRWVIEERFTSGPKVIGRLHITADRLLAGVDVENDKGEVAPLQYDPPVPYQIVEMEIGQKRTIETTVCMPAAKFTVPSTMVVERLDDETVVVPAGEFAGCRHYKVVSDSTFDIKIAKVPLTETRERWYHPRVNGLVKEAYARGPVKFLTWSRPGYTATSVLASFDRVEVPPALVPAPLATAPTRVDDAPSGGPSRRAMVWVLLGGVAIAVAVIWRRRTKSKPAAVEESPARP
jgi:hypothetical protein